MRRKRRRESEGEITVLNMTDEKHNTLGNGLVNDSGHTHCANSDQGGQYVHMPPRDEDNGLRLIQALSARNMNKAKLARHAKVSPSTVQKWEAALSRGDITDSMWHSCARALQDIGIDPNEVRPGARAPSKSRGPELIDPIMAINDRGLLNLLLEILTLEDSTDRDFLAKLVNSKIARL